MTPAEFRMPARSERIQVLIAQRMIPVEVKTTFPDHFQFIGKLLIESQDPRGDFLVAEWQQNHWVFKHSLTPEQAGERPLTVGERAKINAQKPVAPSPAAGLPQADQTKRKSRRK